MKIFKADKIFDGEKFIYENAIVIENNKIKDVFHLNKKDELSIENLQVLNGIIVPGFVNVHCHLELSYLQNILIEKAGMLGFLKQMFQKRHLFEKEKISQKIKEWDQRMYLNGIVAVGDIVNTNDTLDIKTKSKIEYVNFIEVFGLNKEKSKSIIDFNTNLKNLFLSNGLQSFLVPHSPYSLSDDLWNHYFENINNGNSLASIHFIESRAELDLIFNKGASAMKDYFIGDLGYSEKDISHISNKFSDYLIKFVEYNERLILVHNTFLNEKILELLIDNKDKIYFCICPNANLFIEDKLPNIELINNFTNQICIGTDSLASNYNLSIIDEMNTLLKHFNIPIEIVLQWATANGAKALNIHNQYGYYIRKNYSPPFNLIKINGRQIIHQKVLF